ncbi:MAG: M48 family metallopeptidase [Thaumarchaeota archaeon]|mgnify:FL=1|jgi:predicted metal-dependent hydrolase|nr:M48 family metallopeptidase [Nitrososphaerota archaeon]
MNSVTFGNSIIKYNVKRVTNRKTTQIFVDKLGVQIISPSKTTQKEIKDIVIKNSKWIYSKQLWANKQSDMKISFKQGTRLPYLGKNYLLKIKESNNEKVSLSQGKFIIKVNKNTTKKVQKLFKEWLKLHAQKIIERKTTVHAKKIGVKYEKIIIKDHKERWGSVSKNKSLNINLSILCAPSKIINYVIIHELCHLKIPDHSPKYWNLLYKMMPDYETHKEWLSVNWKLLNF